jgi:hypothetical protein
MVAGFEVFVSVQVIDHLIECVDLTRLRVGATVWIAKGCGPE